MQQIDINCDLGEGLGNEHLLMPLISSCNIACGGHAGDEKTIESVIKLAGIHQVKIGAHPSFPDVLNFGREMMDISSKSLKKSLLQQIDLVRVACITQRLALHHVKLHGALYHFASYDNPTANLIFEIINEIDLNLYLYLPYGTKIHRMALELGVKHKAEAFADRNYRNDWSLVSRKENDAMLTEANKIAYHLLSMIKNQEVKSIDGKILKIHAETFCFHGDQIGVEKTLKLVRKILSKNDVIIK